MSDGNTLVSYALTPGQMIGEITDCVLAGIVPYIQGPPGIAKSAICHQIANNFMGSKLKLIDCRLASYQPEDLNGFPMKKESRKKANGDPLPERAGFVPFDTFPTEEDDIPEGYEGWFLLLDELSSAQKDVQAAAYKLILDRTVGSHKLHPAVAIVAAGNRDKDKAVTVKMSTALQSRMIHYEMKPDPKAWVEWAIGAKLDDRIIGYISFNPDYLMNFNPDHQDKTFACPRTWEFLSKLIKTKEVSNENLPIMARVVGTIGQGAGTDFITFASQFGKLPSLTEICDKGGDLKPPVEASTKYAVISMLMANSNEENIGKVIPYVKGFSVEFQVVFVRGVNQRHPKLRAANDDFGKYLLSMARYLG